MNKTIIKSICALCGALIFFCCQSDSTAQSAKTVVKISPEILTFSDGSTQAFPKAGADQTLTTFFLLRHAEKDISQGNDPPLLQAGTERAQRLAMLFKDAGITKIFSTPTKRAYATASPLAAVLNIPVDLRDVKNAEDAASYYLDLAAGQRIFIAGHANTNPQLINFFMKKEVLPQIPDNQQDDLYVLFVPSDGAPSYWALKY